MKSMEIKEQENLSMNVNQQDKVNSSEKGFERREIENTPFWGVSDGKIWFGMLGKHRITDEAESYEELVNILREPSWNLIVTVVGATIEEYKKLEKADKIMVNKWNEIVNKEEQY
ncbi:MAG: hypothetical protein [Wigfec virus K19_94]|nr:MAG: hypothetical protein [Wigfec virus K19_94]